MLLWEVMGIVGQSGEGPGAAPNGGAWSPLPPSQAYPAKLECPHPKAYGVPSTGLASATGKHIRGQFPPGARDLSKHMAASACIV